MRQKNTQRREPRREVGGLPGRLRLRVDAAVLNLGLTGAALETKRRWTPGRRHRMVVGHADAALAVSCTVARCILRRTERNTAGDAVPVYEVGVCFDEVLGAKGVEVMRFLAASGIVEAEDRIVERFAPRPGAQIRLDLECGFLVESLSPSGMLIAAEVDPEPGEVSTLEVDLNGTPIRAAGRFAGVRPAPSTPESSAPRIAVEFLALEEGDRRKLEEFLACPGVFDRTVAPGEPVTA